MTERLTPDDEVDGSNLNGTHSISPPVPLETVGVSKSQRNLVDNTA